jgi:hypothetical protein
MRHAPGVETAPEFYSRKNAAALANGGDLQPVTNVNGKFGAAGLVDAGLNHTRQSGTDARTH